MNALDADVMKAAHRALEAAWRDVRVPLEIRRLCSEAAGRVEAAMEFPPPKPDSEARLPYTVKGEQPPLTEEQRAILAKIPSESGGSA